MYTHEFLSLASLSDERLAEFSDAFLFSLYSSRLSSKLGSSKYSWRAPARDTGACGWKGVSGSALDTERSTDVFEIGYGDVQEILQFPRDAQELDDLLRLTAEVAIDLQGVLGVDMRHLEIMFCPTESVCRIVLSEVY